MGSSDTPITGQIESSYSQDEKKLNLPIYDSSKITPKSNDVSSSGLGDDTTDIGAEELSETGNQQGEGRVHPRRPEDWNYPKRNVARICAAYYGFIVFGMSDSSIGVLLPTLEAYYGISYLIVSLAFLSPFTGYAIAALLADKMHRLLGRWGICVLGTACELICYIISSTAPPYPLFVVGYGIAGFGNGCLESAWNSWMGSLDHANQAMGILHGFYGLGGILCPAIFTAMIGNGIRWNFCYFLMISMSSMSVIFSTVAFWGDNPQMYKERIAQDHLDDDEAILSVNESQEQESDERIIETRIETDEEPEITISEGGRVTTEVGEGRNPPVIDIEEPAKKISTATSTMKDVFKNRLVWLLAIVLFLYVGGEVAFGGWISTFMIKIRGGEEKKMGYVTTGFWAGLTVGRMGLGFIIGHYQYEDFFVAGFLSAALVFLLLVWLVPVLGVSAACAALFGVAIGPLFPTIVVAALKKLPKRLHVSGIGFCVALGGAGAAIPPFINGVIANKYGPRVLGPFDFVLFGLMLVVWILVITLYPYKMNRQLSK